MTDSINKMHTCAALTFAVILAIVAGCGSTSMQSEVSGTVKLDGKPIGPGTIAFVPTEHGRKAANGLIESDGSYNVKAIRGAGLSAGQYRVAISIHEMPKNVKPGDRPPVGKSLIPEKYEDETKSGLQYKIEPGRNTIDVELMSR